MVAYQHFMALSNSADTQHRGEAAHMVATAFVEHDGPQDERAALYAAVLGFLDDVSVKVRGSLALALLHSEFAPRLIMLSLAKDAPIIARAVVQYSPVLLDVDLIGVIKANEASVLLALSARKKLSSRVIERLVKTGNKKIILNLLDRKDLEIPENLLSVLVESHGNIAAVRGKLLSRKELPAYARLLLVEEVKLALSKTRMVKGAIAKGRLKRLMRDALDQAATKIGEKQSIECNKEFATYMQENECINTRLLLHSLVNGRVLFFADCIALVGEMPAKKVFALLKDGSRVALNALFCQCGMSAPLRNLMARLVIFARQSDLAQDDAARHFVVTALIEELIVEHDGEIPVSIEEAFRYLDEQNLLLARYAARGVMPSFARDINLDHHLPTNPDFAQVSRQTPPEEQFPLEEQLVANERLSLPAA